MSDLTKVVSIKVKRTDLGGEFSNFLIKNACFLTERIKQNTTDDSFEVKTLGLLESLESDMDALKTFLSESFEVRAEDVPYKVFKLRNAEGAFIPLTHILRAEDLQEGYSKIL